MLDNALVTKNVLRLLLKTHVQGVLYQHIEEQSENDLWRVKWVREQVISPRELPETAPETLDSCDKDIQGVQCLRLTIAILETVGYAAKFKYAK